MASQADAVQVRNALAAFLASKNFPPTQQWLETFMPSIRVNTPLPALQRTALFRIVASDLTTSVHAELPLCFPADLSDPDVRERKVRGPITAQVLDVEDIGRSRWSQVEAIEMEERGETTKGREIIRVVADEQDNSDPHTPPTAVTLGAGPHKLLLQDAKGVQVYAFELERVQGIGLGMAIGTKLVLRDVPVARGVVMLSGRCTEVVGGKVEVWDKKWREERKMVLREKAGLTDHGGEAG